MTYYLLPRTNIFLYKHIQYSVGPDNPCVISTSLANYLYEIKTKINEREREWDLYKKYTNPYEYIHTIIPSKKKSISKHRPLSRSYFKMIEMINTFNIQFPPNEGIRTFHLAEGPGGFIEALVHSRNQKKDVYIGMTILDIANDYNIPAWKKSQSFLRENSNVLIETGSDHTGNILSLDNFVYCKERYGSSMDLITADGGFDFSINFNKQELHIADLLFAQVCFALCMQKKNGTFILKLFDCFMQHSVDILYILSAFYEKVYMIKPHTSRFANSEKYIVCKGFIHTTNTVFYPYLFRAFHQMTSLSQGIDPAASTLTSGCASTLMGAPGLTNGSASASTLMGAPGLTNGSASASTLMGAPGLTKVSGLIRPLRFLDISISYCFLTKLEEYNAIFGQQQLENIHSTISLIDNKNKQDKIDHLIKTNLTKSIQWCIKHQVPFSSIDMCN